MTFPLHLNFIPSKWAVPKMCFCSSCISNNNISIYLGSLHSFSFLNNSTVEDSNFNKIKKHISSWPCCELGCSRRSSATRQGRIGLLACRRDLAQVDTWDEKTKEKKKNRWDVAQDLWEHHWLPDETSWDQNRNILFRSASQNESDLPFWCKMFGSVWSEWEWCEYSWPQMRCWLVSEGEEEKCRGSFNPIQLCPWRNNFHMLLAYSHKNHPFRRTVISVLSGIHLESQGRLLQSRMFAPVLYYIRLFFYLFI